MHYITQYVLHYYVFVALCVLRPCVFRNVRGWLGAGAREVALHNTRLGSGGATTARNKCSAVFLQFVYPDAFSILHFAKLYQDRQLQIPR